MPVITRSMGNNTPKNAAVKATTVKATATLATIDELNRINLTPWSKDPSGQYSIVVSATELDYIYVCQMGEKLQGKWVIAPQGYYWKHCSKKCYYWFDWFELTCIPL